MSPSDGHVAVLGGGLIGRSWTALFLAAGRSVAVFDPDPATKGRTAPGVVAAARRFYASVGKVTIELRREVPGHVANRLQAALWREAIHLVDEGVASVHDIDTAVSSGPGLRWAVMGPTLLFHLGGDDGGLATFCERYADSFHRWWADLGDPRLDDATTARLVDGLTTGTQESVAELVATRDALLAAVVAATHAPDDRDR